MYWQAAAASHTSVHSTGESNDLKQPVCLTICFINKHDKSGKKHFFSPATLVLMIAHLCAWWLTYLSKLNHRKCLLHQYYGCKLCMSNYMFYV